MTPSSERANSMAQKQRFPSHRPYGGVGNGGEADHSRLFNSRSYQFVAPSNVGPAAALVLRQRTARVSPTRSPGREAPPRSTTVPRKRRHTAAPSSPPSTCKVSTPPVLSIPVTHHVPGQDGPLVVGHQHSQHGRLGRSARDPVPGVHPGLAPRRDRLTMPSMSVALRATSSPVGSESLDRTRNTVTGTSFGRPPTTAGSTSSVIRALRW